MKLFLDTADVDSISDSFLTGLIDGVTTNPTLMMKSGKNPEDVYQDLINLGAVSYTHLTLPTILLV